MRRWGGRFGRSGQSQAPEHRSGSRSWQPRGGVIECGVRNAESGGGIPLGRRQAGTAPAAERACRDTLSVDVLGTVDTTQVEVASAIRRLEREGRIAPRGVRRVFRAIEADWSARL